MNNTIELPTKYVVIAFKEGIPVFYALDRHSGGYPFWSDYQAAAEKWTDLEKAMVGYNDASDGNPGNYMRKEVTSIKLAVLHQTIALDEIDDAYVVEKQKKAALAKLTDKEKEILGIDIKRIS